MRIAFLGIVSACDPMRIGGAESVTRRLVSAISSKGHDVAIILYGALKDDEAQATFDEDVKLIYCRTFSSALDKLSELNCEVAIEIHVNKRDIFRYFVYKTRKKHSVMFSKIFLMYPSGRLRKLLNYRLRVAYCNSVFAISPRLVNDLKKYGINAIWLPPPVPKHYFGFEKENLGDKTRISYIGRLGDDKGCKEILVSFQSLEQLSNVEFSIRGYYDPNDQHSINLHKAFQKLKRIKYEGVSQQANRYSFSSESLLLNYLRETDLLVVPYTNLRSTIDVPLLLIEGLATKCAVLTTNVGDNAFFIENDDFVIDVSDDLTAKLRQVIKPEIIKKEISRISSRKLRAIYADDRVADILLYRISHGLFEIQKP